MQIKVKTLKGQMVEVPAEADTLVSELKARIEGALPQGEAPAGCQRVIHKGKELEDGSTVVSHGITEQDFLVVMVRTKPATAAAPATPAPAPAPAPAQAPAPAPAPAPTGPPPALVEQLKEMGFPESQVVAALRASGNDPTVAIEFLFSGNIPASSLPAEEAGSAGGGGMGVNLAAGGGRGRGNPAVMARLLSSPQFEELQRLVRETPTDLEAAVGALATTNPDLLRLLNEDPESFWEALLGAEGMETGDEGDDEDEDEEDGDEEAAAIEAATLGATLTAEDEAAIGRLQEMGFDREQALQAYLLAGKDETLTVNMLLGA